MNVLGGFVIGLGMGAVITFFTIILFAKYMPEGQKEIYKETARIKWGQK